MEGDPVILKISGEALSADGSGFSKKSLQFIKDEIIDIMDAGAHPCIVLGGGNIYRGRSGMFSRVNGDRMGMLATLINAVALSDYLNLNNVKAQVFSSVKIDRFAEFYRTDLVTEAIKKGIIPIFGGGTANPYFSTDTLAALRAAELGIDVILKGSTIDGIYDKDPKKHADARKLSKLNPLKDSNMDFGVIFDPPAFYIAGTSKTDVVVYDFFKKGNTSSAYKRETGTQVVWEE